MANEPQNISINISERDSVTALLYLAPKKERAGITFILAHGAGAGQLHPFMRLFADGLAERGIDVLTFNFIYMEQGRSIPDPKAKLESCYRAAMDWAVEHKKLKGNRLAIGGKSMGGRIASQVAAQRLSEAESLDGKNAIPPISGLVFLGYPLHPPGRPDKIRDAHLAEVEAPMLFMQGSRDAFGTEDEIRAVIKRLKLNAKLQVVAGGDHSLKVPKSAGIPQAQVYEIAMDGIFQWLLSI